MFVKFRLQPQKMNSVSFTYRHRSTPKYYVCCVTRQYSFRIHFFACQRLSEGPAYLYNYLYLLLSSFVLTNTSFAKISVTLDQDYLRPSITWQKEKPAMFWCANFPRLSRQFTYIINNFQLSKLEERMNKNKPKRKRFIDQKFAEIKLAPFSVGKLPFLYAPSTWYKEPGNSTNRSWRGFETNNRRSCWQPVLCRFALATVWAPRPSYIYVPRPRFLMMMVQTKSGILLVDAITPSGF